MGMKNRSRAIVYVCMIALVGMVAGARAPSRGPLYVLVDPPLNSFHGANFAVGKDRGRLIQDGWEVFDATMTYTLTTFGRIATLNSTTTAATGCSHICPPGVTLPIVARVMGSPTHRRFGLSFVRPLITNASVLEGCVEVGYECDEPITPSAPLNPLSIFFHGSQELKGALFGNITCTTPWTLACAVIEVLTALRDNTAPDPGALGVLRGSEYNCLLAYLGLGELPAKSPCWAQLGPMCYSGYGVPVCVTAHRKLYGLVKTEEPELRQSMDCTISAKIHSRGEVIGRKIVRDMIAGGCDNVIVACDLPWGFKTPVDELTIPNECKLSAFTNISLPSFYIGKNATGRVALELRFDATSWRSWFSRQWERTRVVSRIVDTMNKEYRMLIINWIPTPDGMGILYAFMSELSHHIASLKGRRLQLGLVISGSPPILETYDLKWLKRIVNRFYVSAPIQMQSTIGGLKCPTQLDPSSTSCGLPDRNCPGHVGYQHLTYTAAYLTRRIPTKQLSFTLDLTGQAWAKQYLSSGEIWGLLRNLPDTTRGGGIPKNIIDAELRGHPSTRVTQGNGCHRAKGLLSFGEDHIQVQWATTDDIVEMIDWLMGNGIVSFKVDQVTYDISLQEQYHFKTILAITDAVKLRIAAFEIVESQMVTGGNMSLNETEVWEQAARAIHGNPDSNMTTTLAPSTSTPAVNGSSLVRRRRSPASDPEIVHLPTIPFTSNFSTGTVGVQVGSGPRVVCPGVVATIGNIVFSRIPYAQFKRLSFFKNLYVTWLENMTECTPLTTGAPELITEATSFPSTFAVDINTFSPTNSSDYYVVGYSSPGELVQYSPLVKQSCVFINTNETFTQSYVEIDDDYYYTEPTPVDNGFIIPEGIKFFMGDLVMAVDYINFNITCMNYNNPTIQSCIAAVCAANASACTTDATTMCSQGTPIIQDFERSNELLKASIRDFELEHEKMKMFAIAPGGTDTTVATQKFGLSIAAITMSGVALAAASTALVVATLAASKIDALQSQLDITSEVIEKLGNSVAIISARLDRNIQAVNGRIDDLQKQLNKQFEIIEKNMKQISAVVEAFADSTKKKMREIITYQQWYQQIISLTHQVTQGAIQVGYKVGMLRTCIKSLLAGTMAGCPSELSIFTEHPGLTYSKTVKAMLYQDKKLFIVNQVPRTLDPAPVHRFIPAPSIIKDKVCWPDYKLSYVNGKVYAPVECTGKYCSPPVEPKDYLECLATPTTCKYVCGDCYRGICYNRTADELVVPFEEINYKLALTDLDGPLFNNVPQIMVLEDDLDDVKIELEALTQLNTSAKLEDITDDINHMKETIREYREEMERLRVTGFGEWLAYLLYALLASLILGAILALVCMGVKCYSARRQYAAMAGGYQRLQTPLY
ncbi:membrane Allo46; type 1 membrane protein [Silurid herpesvirus 1]|nr:membrane Allo46; type 1 membrane protein [Silurid herpesvirus 1]